jgi:hypothetical protein
MHSNHLMFLTEFADIKHQNNCLILANELRMRCSQMYFPDALMAVASELDSMDFRFMERLMNIYGTQVNFIEMQSHDIVLMNFNKQVCLGTILDDLIFYLGNSGMECRSVEVLGKYVIGAWRPKDYCSEEFRHLME